MRILGISTRPPYSPRRGDQARAAGWIDELAPRHDLRWIAQRPPGFARGGELPVPLVEMPLGRLGMASGLRAAFSLPAQVALHRAGGTAAAVRKELQRSRPDVVVLMLSRLGWLLPILDGVPTVVDLVDSLALNMRRRAEFQPALRPLWRWEAARLGRWERRLVRRAARATVVSERDRRALVGDDAELAARVEVVPFGVPLATDKAIRGVEDRPPVVLLAGNLGYFPTVDGARWLAAEIWPRVRAAVPEAELWLAGSRPAGAVRRAATVLGGRLIVAPEDLGAVRRRATVAVAPLRAGSGTPIKILEAIADGVPVVTTSAGAGGLDALAGGEVAIADDAAGFAGAVVGLLRDRGSARAQAQAARTWLAARHDRRRVALRFEEILEAARSA